MVMPRKSLRSRRSENKVKKKTRTKGDGGKANIAKRYPDSAAAQQSRKPKVTVEGPKAAKRTLDQQRLREGKKIATDVKSPPKPPKTNRRAFGTGSSKVINRNGKMLANVSAEQLKKTGMSLRAYMNSWNKTGSRPTKKKSK
tara:strand:- start:468 stop:893 length:426 start_codon:yes stop_codon:yes gene_type:complete